MRLQCALAPILMPACQHFPVKRGSRGRSFTLKATELLKDLKIREFSLLDLVFGCSCSDRISIILISLLVGESGSDITNEISKYASKCAIAIRGKHGHLIPRIQAHGRVTDLNTNRCRYSNPYVFGDWIGFVNQFAKRIVASFAKDSDQMKVMICNVLSQLGQPSSTYVLGSP